MLVTMNVVVKHLKCTKQIHFVKPTYQNSDHATTAKDDYDIKIAQNKVEINIKRWLEKQNRQNEKVEIGNVALAVLLVLRQHPRTAKALATCIGANGLDNELEGNAREDKNEHV